MCHKIIGPETILFAGGSCIFQPGNFTGWGSEGVKGTGFSYPGLPWEVVCTFIATSI